MMDSNQTNEFAKVLIPRIRRVMPNIIARQIIGVTPMTGPMGGIFGLAGHLNPERPPGWWDGHKVRMTKDVYKNFLRLNDRKKHQTRQDFIKAGYPWASIRDLDYNEAVQSWLDDSIGKYRYVVVWDAIFFENKNDHLLYTLRWS
jgi:hypothetical protein